MDRFPALMYHSASPLPGRFRSLGVPGPLLRGQLEALIASGRSPVGLSDVLASADRRAAVAITFDDAYGDFESTVVPILDDLNARATLYVPTGHLGRGARWLGRRASSMPRLMDWHALRSIVASGLVEIGSHSHTHAQMDTLAIDAVRFELRHSRELLEQMLGVPVTSFCYPNGYHSRLVRHETRAAGYDNACEVGRRLRDSSHRFALSRLAVGPQHAPEAVVKQLRAGGPIAVPTLKRGLQPAWRELRRARAHMPIVSAA